MKKLFFLTLFAVPLKAEFKPYLSMFSEAKYSAGQTHFEYVNPSAPKGGALMLQIDKNFDSLNPYVFKGDAAPGLLGAVYGTLFARSADEPFSLYGYIAESVELAPDRLSWMIVKLRKTATFHDGTPILADDLIATNAILKTKGNPARKMYQSRVLDLKKIDDHTVHFIFDKEKADRETPLLIALMPVFSKKFIDAHDFDHTTHIIPNGTGPYRVEAFSANGHIVLKRISNHWSENLLAFKGQYNFDTIRYDLYRDRNVAKEALKALKLDIFQETDPLAFDREFNIPAVKDGRLQKIDFEHKRPFGMFGFALNMRREPFNDIRVRQALALAFDYDWVNKNYFKGMYKPSNSFFNNADFDAGLKQEHCGTHREACSRSIKLLKEAGYVFQNGKMMKEGKPLEIEVVYRATDHTRYVAALKDDLLKIGVTLKDRFIESAQWIKLTQDYNCDAILWLWGVTASPGQELYYYFGSESANKPGTRNYMGLKDEKVDGFIKKALASNDYADYEKALKDLDRQLLSHHFVIPLGFWNHDYYLKSGRLREPHIPEALNRKLQMGNTEDRATRIWWEGK